MTSFAILGAILFAIGIGAMSPGPSFVLVSRISVAHSRLHGIATAIGMGLGGALFAVLALAGLVALLQQVDWLYLALKCAGGLYLVYLGIVIWRGASEPLAMATNGATDAVNEGSGKQLSPLRAMLVAFATQISNPKTAVVYASIFAALMPQAPPTAVLIALPPLVFVVEAGWYLIVALAFSAHRSQRAYLKWKVWVDRLAGAVIGALGIRLIGESITAFRR
ncbi:LysE family translocator [Rhizobium sp. G187]|uniref:LysE family translocator n=1 Tax=Rhizobium sp. G187 TaxID=3451352 RepID=UPI003EE73BCB